MCRNVAIASLDEIMSATALLNRTPNPDNSDIDAAMAGNICRCGTYVRIRRAIHRAAAEGGDAMNKHLPNFDYSRRLQILVAGATLNQGRSMALGLR